jgi:succinate dehydrogenase/fumarate reductase cytochrome b subunit
LPLATFLVLHLGRQAFALGGRDTYDRQLGSSRSMAGLVLEIGLVYLPLLFHAGYGIASSLVPSAADARPSGERGVAPLRRRQVQRITAPLVAAFLLLHLWQFRVRLWTGELDASDFFAELCASLSSTALGGVPVMAITYLIGVAAAAFHFSNGLYGFCQTWGITISDRATRVASGVSALAGVGLFAVGAITVIYLATGSVSLPSLGY